MDLSDESSANTVVRISVRCRASLPMGHCLHITLPVDSTHMTPLLPSLDSVRTLQLFTTPETYPEWTLLRPLVIGSTTSVRGSFKYRYAVKTSAGEAVGWEGESEPGTSETTGSFEGAFKAPFRTLKLDGLKMKEQGSVEILDVFENGLYGPDIDVTAKLSLDSNCLAPSGLASSAEVAPGRAAHDAPGDEAGPGPGPGEEVDRLSNLFLICYHLPVKVFKGKGGDWRCSWKNSLIAKTEGSIAGEVSTNWIGGLLMPDLEQDDKDQIIAILAKMNCIPVFVQEDLHELHYMGMCKQVLWPAFHNVDLLDLSTSSYGLSQSSGPSNWDQSRVHKDRWRSYKTVNEMFLDEVTKVMKEGDTAWVHDYHLALLPKMIEDKQTAENGRRITNTVFFLHIPFPTSQIFRELECGTSILEGILAADVVGFHAFGYARHFLNACKRLMGLNYESKLGGLIGLQYRGRTVMVTTSHVSIEPALLNSSLAEPDVLSSTDSIKSKHGGKVIIAGIDVGQRLSGVLLKFLAYEKLLDDYPVYQKKVILLQRCTAPGTRVVDEEVTLNDIKKIVGRIKKKFGPSCVDYEEAEAITMDERVAIWKSSDVYLGTAVREGLNLMPCEYVYCKQSNPGVVVTSEFSAACNILNGAIRVNPFDIQQTVNAIDVALRMDKQEKETRLGRDIDFVSQRTASQWSRHVLQDLQEAVSATAKAGEDTENGWVNGSVPSKLAHLDIPLVKAAFDASKQRVIICDYGGTLLAKEALNKYLKKDISATSGRVPRKEVIEALKTLCADPKNIVFVVSGVNREELVRVLGEVDNLGLAASNGAFYALPPVEVGGPREWKAFEFGVNWDQVKSVAIPIITKYAARTNGSSLKILDLSISWSFFSCDPEWGSIQAKYIVSELEEQLQGYDVRVVMLKGQVEIVPRMLHKGVVAKNVLREISSRTGEFPQFVLAVGDDNADEPTFSAVFDFLAEQTSLQSEEESKKRSVAQPMMTDGDVSTSSTVSLPNCGPPRDQYAFTVTVGEKGSTNASEFLYNSREVEDLLVSLANPAQIPFCKRGSASSGGSWDDSRDVDSSFYEL